MEVLHLVIGYQSSCSAWRALEHTLASTSNSRIIQLHGSLQDLRQGDELVTQFMQKAKALFDELAAAGRPVSLKDFNLYVFYGIRGEFKDLVTSLITKAEPLSYANLHSHLLTHEFLHKSSAAIHAPLLRTPSTPSSALVVQRQTFGNSGRDRGRFNGGWRPNQSSTRGNRFAVPRPDAASRTPPSVTVGRAHGRALGSAIGGKIPAANCVKISAIQLPTVLNSSSKVMANSLLSIWCSAISPQPVLLIGFRIPVSINTSHLILPP
jgi:hypothetical protein